MQRVKDEFLVNMAKKPFIKFLKRWFKGRDYSDIQVAKGLSSMITHSLIEMDKAGAITFKVLDLPLQVKVLSQFIEGELTSGQVKKIYQEKFDRFSDGD